MGKIGQNPKIGQFWRPVAPQPYVVQKVDLPRKLPCSWTTTRSKQYISAVHPLTCSLLWVRCLFDPSKFGVLGANDPWMESFHKFLSKIRVPTTIHVSWPNLAAVAKLPKSPLVLLTKKTPASGTRPSPPFRPHLADRAQNFVNVVGHWAVHVHRLWSRSAAVCRTYSGKKSKKAIQYIKLRLKACV